MKKSVPFVAFSNGELEAAPPMLPGDVIDCPTCGGKHAVTCGKDARTGDSITHLMFYTCGKNSHLAGVCGREMEPKDEKGKKK